MGRRKRWVGVCRKIGPRSSGVRHQLDVQLPLAAIDELVRVEGGEVVVGT